jgi:hypothetical protein
MGSTISTEFADNSQMRRKLIVLTTSVLLLLASGCQAFARDEVRVETGTRTIRIDYKDLAVSSSISNQEERQYQAAGITHVAVSAGRVDWAFFPWPGHRSAWAAPVRNSGLDFLARDTQRFSKWAHVTAVVDVLAPVYIKEHPGTAAVTWGGAASSELVSLTQMTSGPFNQELLAFISAVSERTPAESITLVELFYYVDGFGSDDLTSFQQDTGKADWPRLATGEININDASVNQWRNARIEVLLKQVAQIAHQNKQEFYLEVKPTRFQIQNQDWSAYRTYLKYVDKLVIFSNPIYDDPDPLILRQSIRNLNLLGTDKVIYELGAWKSGTQPGTADTIAMDPGVFDGMVHAAVQAGAASFWFTPSFLITSSYWSGLNGN